MPQEHPVYATITSGGPYSSTLSTHDTYIHTYIVVICSTHDIHDIVNTWHIFHIPTMQRLIFKARNTIWLHWILNIYEAHPSGTKT